MPIFRYTLKKILVSPSTWVIFILTLIILGLAWGLPVAMLKSEGVKIDWTKELILSEFLPAWKVLAFTTLIGLMLLIFIGVKSTQIFRDEIDDGTLLILVSKPISRNRIWAEKWLVFQTIVISYIFFSILLGGLVLAIPGIGNSVVYLTLLPYMGILFGISLLFDVIFTSIVLLISLVLNSKATIALTVGFAALTNIFSQAIDPLVSIPATYFQYSHAVAAYHDVEKKLKVVDLNWFNEQLTNPKKYQDDVAKMMEKVYRTNIPGISYPEQYDPVKEQEVLHAIIANPSAYPDYSQEEVALITHIVNISNIFRQWQQQSYQELMTSIGVGQNHSIGGTALPGSNGVNYSAYNVMKVFNTPINKEILDTYNTKILQKKIMRYFNVFYQLYYLWNGAWQENSSLYIADSDYQRLDDPYLVSFNKGDSKLYLVDRNSGTNHILDFPILVTFYVILGTALLGASWYVFNRRDFA